MYNYSLWGIVYFISSLSNQIIDLIELFLTGDVKPRKSMCTT